MVMFKMKSLYELRIVQCITGFESPDRFFLENNNKTQTISLVTKRFKLFWFLAIRVKRARFPVFLF